ncbi:transcriptional regulator, AraC family [Gulosibacter sp. 10]|nr:transcriptional regulator, AraC family [Gulosibacter sp. 10]
MRRAGERAETRALPVYGAGDLEVPFVIRGMSEELERETAWEPHSHPTHELLWNQRGASTATIDSRVWTITPSLGLWIPAGTLHTGYAGAGTWYRTAHFGVHAIEPIAEEPVAVQITPLLRLLLDRLAEPELAEESRALTERMVLDVLKPADACLIVQAPQGRLLRPIVEALDRDPADARTLGEWAEALGVSPRTITRAFHAETELSFSQWQAAIRAQRAVMLLAEGMPVEEVAERVGYASASAFGAAFRRTTGWTPSRFR